MLVLVLMMMPFMPKGDFYSRLWTVLRWRLDVFHGLAGNVESDVQWRGLRDRLPPGADVCGSWFPAWLYSLVSLGLLWLAARNVRRRWREEPPSARVQQMEKVFCEPVIGVAFLRGWMRRKLARNPIGWLEQRRWSGRLVTWAWFAIIISVQSAVLTDRNFFRSYGGAQAVMAWLLAGSMAASAAGSFRRERETGVLELLLVSPLTTGQIIGGRLRGLWGQFLPSIVMLLGIWVYLAKSFAHRSDRG